MMRRALLALPLVAGLLVLAAPSAAALPTTASARGSGACVWVTALHVGVCVPDNVFDGLPDAPDLP